MILECEDKTDGLDLLSYSTPVVKEKKEQNEKKKGGGGGIENPDFLSWLIQIFFPSFLHRAKFWMNSQIEKYSVKHGRRLWNPFYHLPDISLLA